MSGADSGKSNVGRSKFRTKEAYRLGRKIPPVVGEKQFAGPTCGGGAFLRPSWEMRYFKMGAVPKMAEQTQPVRPIISAFGSFVY